MVKIQGIRGKRGYARIDGRVVNLRSKSANLDKKGFVWTAIPERRGKTKDGRTFKIPAHHRWKMGAALKAKLHPRFKQGMGRFKK